MKIQNLTKRCERCEQLYLLPNIKESYARRLIIEYFPCEHCGFSKDSSNKAGRCRDCSIPFVFIDHHAHGRCKRCDMRQLRHKNKH